MEHPSSFLQCHAGQSLRMQATIGDAQLLPWPDSCCQYGFACKGQSMHQCMCKAGQRQVKLNSSALTWMRLCAKKGMEVPLKQTSMRRQGSSRSRASIACPRAVVSSAALCCKRRSSSAAQAAASALNPKG